MSDAPAAVAPSKFNPYVLGAMGLLAACLLGAAIVALRKPCPCADHAANPEKVATQVAKESARMAEQTIHIDDVTTTNGHPSFPDLDQPKVSE